MKIRIVRFVIEAERRSTVKEDAKFVGETTAKEIGGMVIGTAEDVHQHKARDSRSSRRACSTPRWVLMDV